MGGGRTGQTGRWELSVTGCDVRTKTMQVIMAKKDSKQTDIHKVGGRVFVRMRGKYLSVFCSLPLDVI